MSTFFTVLHVMVCLVLILVVLLQRGKGSDVGAALGGGGSNTMFGARGAGNFLTKLTTGSAILFMVTSMSLAYLGNDISNPLEFGEDEIATDPLNDESGSEGTGATDADALEEVDPDASANTLEEIPQPETDPES